MLLHIARPAIAVAETDDPVIEAMVNLMPDYSAGGRLHDLYVNKLRSALPGNYSQLIGSGPSFRSIFFPDWQPDPLLSLVGNTGLDDGWWSGFSVAVLCQAIAEMGSSIRGQMLTDKINADVSSFNGTLRARSSRVYALVLATTYAPLVSLLQQVNRDTARQQFHDSLLSNVLNRQLWYQAGMWTSPDWEMFNQYAKYIALGASDAEVDTLIGELQAAGLPVPSQVNQEGWRGYAEELRNKPNVDVNDIRGETAGPIGRTTYLPNFGGGMPASLPNGNCYEFTASSQPGTNYRGSPSGCCFTGNTRVLGQDGTSVPLWQVKPGDKVLTRDGTATVAFVARPLRAGRRLYRFVGEGPVFTETHPFLNAAPPDPAATVPMLLALDPRRLAWDVPTLGENGIGTLEPGSLLWTRAAGADRLPVPAAAGRIEEVKDAGDEGLFDLNLATDSGARQEFWAGDGDTFYLVSPEFPVIEEAGAAAITVVAIMEGLFAAGGLDPSRWPPGIVDVINRFGIGVFYRALREGLATTPSFGAPAPSAPLDVRIGRLYGSLDTATADSAAMVAALFDGLMSTVGQWLASIVATGWRTSLNLGGDVLAVTVFDLALTPTNPIPADTPIRLDLAVDGRASSAGSRMWDRRGRANTRFHHYFDQIVHLDMAGEDRPLRLTFAATIDGAPIPTLSAEVPLVFGDSLHSLQSAVLRDVTGAAVGTIRFDTRRLGPDLASQELAGSGLWTGDAADAYANALGAAMVKPVLAGLRNLAPAD